MIYELNLDTVPTWEYVEESMAEGLTFERAIDYAYWIFSEHNQIIWTDGGATC